MKRNLPVTGREYDFPAEANLLSTTDLKGIITYANADFAEVSGFEQDELIGRNHNIVRHPDMPPAAFEDMWRTLKSKRPWMGLVKNRRKNGDHYWVDAFVSPVKRGGRVVEYQSVRLKPQRAWIKRAQHLYPRLMRGRPPLRLRLPPMGTTARLGAVPILTVLPLAATLPLNGAGGGALLTGLALGLGALAWGTRRLRRLAATAREVFDNRAMQYVYTGSTDDLGAIELALKMRGMEADAVLGRMLDASRQLESTARQMDEFVAQLRTGIDRRGRESEQIASAMNEMSATVQQLAGETAAAAEAARRAAAEAETGRGVVGETIDRLNALAGEVEQTAALIEGLEDESRGIGAVLDVIKEIAEQTNLLALNAAIEAARAGERGRGFAVVADEVRTLAQRSRDSAGEIEEMIARLQQQARRAVEAARESRSRARAGVEQAGVTQSSLQRITEAVDTIHTRVSDANGQMEAVAGRIDETVVSVTETMRGSLADMERTAEASGRLARMAEGMQALAAEFRGHRR